MHRFQDKAALVTGGSSGIGFATAARLLAEGARKVIVTGTDSAKLEAAQAALGTRAVAVRADVRDAAALDRLAAVARQETGGRLDVLFANAGTAGFKPIEQVTEADIAAQFGTNVTGVILTIQKLLPLIPDGGAIVLNASAVSPKGLAGTSVYTATKAAVRSLARTLAAELAPRGIRVNAVSPGMIPTPLASKIGLPEEALEAWGRTYVSQTPLARVGATEEIAAAVAFLASADAAYVTGGDLAVDGGWAAV